MPHLTVVMALLYFVAWYWDGGELANHERRYGLVTGRIPGGRWAVGQRARRLFNRERYCSVGWGQRGQYSIDHNTSVKVQTPYHSRVFRVHVSMHVSLVFSLMTYSRTRANQHSRNCESDVAFIYLFSTRDLYGMRVLFCVHYYLYVFLLQLSRR